MDIRPLSQMGASERGNFDDIAELGRFALRLE